jgi:hypothetical protein
MNNLIELKQIEGMAPISVEKKTHPHFNFRCKIWFSRCCVHIVESFIIENISSIV